MICNICPRQCNIDRDLQNGFCGAGSGVTIVRAAPHLWEEPCISGKNGSGTVFFSGCSLQCVFCQNREISRKNVGKSVSNDELYDIFASLKAQKVHNINLVTADHFIPQILPALKRAKSLELPIVLNTSSYLKENIIDALCGTVDIYLADFKFFNDKTALKYANAQDYPDIAKNAIAKMVEQVGVPQFKDDIMTRGVIVRVLVLPDNIIDAKQTIKYLYNTFGDDIYISVMSQYTPVCKTDYPELSRTLTDREYKSVVDFTLSLGVKNAFLQEKTSATENYIPDFKE